MCGMSPAKMNVPQHILLRALRISRSPNVLYCSIDKNSFTPRSPLKCKLWSAATVKL